MFWHTSSAGSILVGEVELTEDEGMVIPDALDIEESTDIEGPMVMLDAIDMAEPIDIVMVDDPVDIEEPTDDDGAVITVDIEPLTPEPDREPLSYVAAKCVPYLPMPPMPPIAMQPKEDLPDVVAGHSTLPIPLNKMLLAQRGRIESWVAASRKAISSLV